MAADFSLTDKHKKIFKVYEDLLFNDKVIIYALAPEPWTPTLLLQRLLAINKNQPIESFSFGWNDMNCGMISEVLHLVSTQPIAEQGLKSIALSSFNGLYEPVAEEIIENLVKICPHVVHIKFSRMAFNA